MPSCKRRGLHEDMMLGLWQLTLGRATFWFTADGTDLCVF